jgi:CubicO group peptidase (beta-lactamase class C family)
MKKTYLPILLSLFLQGIRAQSSPPGFVRDSIDAYIQKGLSDWNLPGLAVVIVKDGQVVWMKGYGVRDIITKKPVDEHTLFMIASNTKLFTGSALAMLETEEKLSLDDPISKYFPDYRLYDSTSTKLVSIRDMLSHRIGTKTFEGDFTFWNTSLSREEIMRRMRYLKPPFHFRQEFGYCNSCFMTAGQIIPVVTGETWEKFVQSHFLSPLGMDQTRILSTAVGDQPNVATPYTTSYSDSLNRVPYDNWNNLAPAASIVSNVSDLSHWLLMQLDSGRYQGKQIISWEALQKTRQANTWVRSLKSGRYPTHFTGYGLGLFMQDYAGRQVYWHTGGAGGMVSNVCFVPEEKLGIAILTNNDNQDFFEALRYQILDAYLGVPYINRSQQALPDFLKDSVKTSNEIKSWEMRLKSNKPELPLSAYTGNYTNTLYGKIQLSPEQDHLIIHFITKPDLTASLEYMDNGEWLLRYNNILYGIFQVKFDITNGKVKSLTTRENPFVEYDPYVFIKSEIQKR